MSLGASFYPQAGRLIPADPVLRERDQKLESLKAVVGKLAHDFNNFLAPQYGYLTMLKDEAPAGSPIAMYINAMGTAAQKAEGYITSILLGMRPFRQFSPRDFPFHQLVDDLLNQWIAEMPKGKTVSVKRDLQEFNYCGDEKQWRTAIDHLLSNARYALAMGGELEVTLSRQRATGQEVQRLGVPTDDLYCLRIRDNGFGMSPETVQRAFEPFFTTRTQIKAPGLGLTIVHGITLYHGGQIELQSVEDRGTIVTVWLPAEPPSQTTGVSSGLIPPSQKKRRALLIEDDPLIKEVLRTWLVRQDLEVESATNEQEARRSLDRSGGECVLVFVETDLQSGRGEDLFAKLSATHPGPAWVFLAGARSPQFSGIAGDEPLVIKKPFSYNAFSDLVRKYTNR